MKSSPGNSKNGVRSPLRDVNGIGSTPPKGCLSFFIPKTKTKTKTPKSRNPNKSPLCEFLQVSDITANSGDLGLSSYDEDYTPVGKFASGSCLDCEISKAINENSNPKSNTANTTTTPPVQVSVSPEMQRGLQSVASLATPASICYGAGHVVSGVTDKRKCRPRGILTIGENIGSICGVPTVPLPAEASMKWLNDKKVRCGEESASFQGFGCCTHSSPSSGHGFSLFAASPASTGHGLIMSPGNKEADDNKGILGNGLDKFWSFRHLNTPHSDSSPSSACTSSKNPNAATGSGARRLSDCQGVSAVTPRCKAVICDEERHCSYDSPSSSSMDSLGSGNVIRTPRTDSSSDNYVGASSFKPKDRVDYEVYLGRETVEVTDLSLEFDGLIDFRQLQKYVDDQNSWVSRTSFQKSWPSPQTRISWRQGLAHRIFEMDEIECCVCLSDEEEDNTNCEPEFGSNGKFGSGAKEACSCAEESISTDARDSDWTMCYKNQLFKL